MADLVIAKKTYVPTLKSEKVGVLQAEREKKILAGGLENFSMKKST